MNARYYDPFVRRFVLADSIVPGPEDPQSYNRYSYVRNDPIAFTDPSGHRPCERVCPGDWVTWEIEFGSAWYGSWDIQQQRSNSATARALSVNVAETTIGILWEPADWAIALSDGAQWYDGLGMLPLIPAAFGDNIGRVATRLIPAGWADEAGQVIGRWVEMPVSDLDKAWARYQAYVTGVEGMEFKFSGIKFDGVIGKMDEVGNIDNLILLDAKHWGSDPDSLIMKLDQSWAEAGILYNVRRQLRAIEGKDIPIQWHLPDKQAVEILKSFFARHRIKNITVKHTPWQP